VASCPQRLFRGLALVADWGQSGVSGLKTPPDPTSNLKRAALTTFNERVAVFAA
jgi:hypothetical protein